MLTDLIQKIISADSFAVVRQWHSSGGRLNVHGTRGTGKSLAMAAVLLERSAACPVQFILTSGTERAENIVNDLTAIFGVDNPLAPVFFPSLETLLYEETSPDLQLMRDRMTVLSRLANGEEIVVVATADAAFHRTLPLAEINKCRQVIKVNDIYNPLELAQYLTAIGYQYSASVENPGQFNRRGGLVDIFPSTYQYPVRLEFFDDEIDSMRIFDPGSQRSKENISQIEIFPAREIIITPESTEKAIEKIRHGYKIRMSSISRDPVRVPGESGIEELLSPAERLTAKIENEIMQLEQGNYFNGVEYYLPYFYAEPATLLDYLPSSAGIIIDEPVHIEENFGKFCEGLAGVESSRLVRGALLPLPYSLYQSFEESFSTLYTRQLAEFTLLGQGMADYNLQMDSRPPDNYGITSEKLQPDITSWLKSGYTVVAATHQEIRMAEVLGDLGFPAVKAVDEIGVLVKRVELNEGTILPDLKIAVLTDGELLGWQKQRRSTKKWRQAPGQVLINVNQLTVGDMVVHINHGIGQYVGMVRREAGGVEREFLQINYAEADKLFVPVDQLDRVQKYSTIGEEPPRINRLGTGEWERIKKRTKKSTEDLAMQLMKLQAMRVRQRGHQYSVDTPWQREMEEGFPWRETIDQLKAIEDVKGDMESENPTDRLICGDVGYGKTEVAIRAAFKAVMDGKQVAILAPTTVLAAQHYRNFRERMAAFPVRVALMSRSVPKREQNRIAGEITGGAVDIVIGTHRILSKDIIYKDLGMVVIDEEQRFGVKQKERFKEQKANVDILTMSATPIPRTLHMALAGLREMSLITTPPEGRMPVRTMAIEADDEVLREAILRELDRDGQVFILHNRISSIYHYAEHIRKVAPQARIAVAHGQMAEGELDQVMYDFFNREFDVLICTAIIENGVDFPNVNTLIVDNAETFGLSQLYQLRGRVGRSDRQAYAYLTWRPRKKLTETAQERIAAIKEFSHLGAGYQIALRDLEIRGAGNLLGSEQSGILASVGFDLYCQMLEEAVRMVKGEYVEEKHDIQIDLPMDAYLPDDYVPDLNQRIDMYRRLASVRMASVAEDLKNEILDRYGKPLPEPVNNLFRLIGVKILCIETGVTHITPERDAIAIRLASNRTLSPQAVKSLSLEGYDWRKRGLPAPAFNQEKVTLYTHNTDKETQLQMLEEIAGRLRVIEDEIANAPKVVPKLQVSRRFGPDTRRFGE
ncbi:MAG: transcription-repair coupling factor [bacterium]